MSGLIDKRKRSREDDYNCDSTPLSKRINNLHLTNYEKNTPDDRSMDRNTTIYKGLDEDPLRNLYQQYSEQSNQLIENTIHYNPELNETQNPFYYLKNKILHDLHFERLKRHTL